MLRKSVKPDLKVDGKLGAATTEAIKAYQSQKGLSINGRLDRATTEALLK